MSEQTPTTSEDLRGPEPSMEDILASIRKIISEDEPVALESPEDVQPAPIVTETPLETESTSFKSYTSDAVSEAAIEKASVLDAPIPDAPIAFAEGDSVDLNIDDVLAGLEEDVLSRETDVVTFEPEEAGLADLEIPAVPDVSSDTVSSALSGDLGDDIESLLDDEGPMEITAKAPSVVVPESVAAPIEVSDPVVSSDDVEMDALLDDILLSSDDDVEAVVESVEVVPNVEDIHVEEIAVADIATDETYIDAEQSDLELVKSLMADLADDTGDIEGEGDLDSLLEIPEMEEANLEETAGLADIEDVAELASDSAESDDDILGGILDMTLEDELKSHPEDLDVDLMPTLDDVLADEQANIVENIAIENLEAETLEVPSFEVENFEAESLEIPSAAEAVSTDAISEGLPSLSEIAAAAEADAAEIETFGSVQPAAAASGLAAVGVGLAAFAAGSSKPEAEFETDIAELSTPEAEQALEEIIAAEAAQIEEETEEVEASSGPEILEAEAVEASLTEIEAVEVTPSTVDTETIQNSLSNQETSMPVKAVKSDTILDEVTETATAGAFAELNQVVEDKAVFNERGPRIGDLVQDALRPMLKEWLDANLKGIVERAVTKEVKRISKGQ